MKQTEAQVQAAIIEALTFDGWLILRINQGGRREYRAELDGSIYPVKMPSRYTRFAYYQALGIPATDKGIADVIAVKAGLDINRDMSYVDGHVGPLFLAIEVKAPGKKVKCPTCDGIGKGGGEKMAWFCATCNGDGRVHRPSKAQADFLMAVQSHGGIGIVADCLEDVAEYLTRAEVQ